MGLQGILLAGGGMNTACCSTGWRLCSCVMFYRLAVVGLQCVLWAGGNVNAVCIWMFYGLAAVCLQCVLWAGSSVKAVFSMSTLWGIE